MIYKRWGDDDDHMIQSSLDTSPGLSRHSELRVVWCDNVIRSPHSVIIPAQTTWYKSLLCISCKLCRKCPNHFLSTWLWWWQSSHLDQTLRMVLPAVSRIPTASTPACIRWRTLYFSCPNPDPHIWKTRHFIHSISRCRCISFTSLGPSVVL